MARRIAVLIGVVAAVIAGLVALPTPAQAADRNGVCETGELCLWQNTGFRAGRYDAFYSVAYMKDRSYVAACSTGCSLNESVSSLANYDRVHWVRLFEHANYSGLYFWRDHYTTTNDLDRAYDLTIDRDENGRPWNDRFSSFCFVSPQGPSPRCR